MSNPPENTVSVLSLAIRPDRYVILLLSFLIFFVLIHPLLNDINLHHTDVHWLIIQMFDLDDENNLPTWFSSFMLLNASMLSWHMAQRGRDAIYWGLLAIGFLLLSIDEVAGMHESINTVIETNWAIPAAILVAVVGLPFLRFLWSMPKRTSIRLVISGALYVGGAIGMELLGADMDEDSFNYELVVSVEEGMEMLGVWFFIRTILFDFRDAFLGVRAD